MTKIFEAVRKTSGEMSDAVLSMISDAERAPEENLAPTDEDSQVRVVLEEDTVPPPPQAAPEPEAAIVDEAPAATAQPATMRMLPVRIASSTPLLPFDDTDTVAAEQYRIIRTRLIQHPKEPRMILISSAGPGEGKTVTAVNIAGALSLKNEGGVLLVDGDLRRSSIPTQLGLPASPGLGEVLSGAATLEQALVQVEQLPNLYVLPAGELQSNPSELLDSAQWTALRARIRSMFRYVVVDSPPVASVADYDLLQAACDGVVLVARPDYTNRHACLRALDLIPKEKLVGVVMNCVAKWLLGRSHYYAPYGYRPNTPAK